MQWGKFYCHHFILGSMWARIWPVLWMFYCFFCAGHFSFKFDGFVSLFLTQSRNNPNTLISFFFLLGNRSLHFSFSHWGETSKAMYSLHSNVNFNQFYAHLIKRIFSSRIDNKKSLHWSDRFIFCFRCIYPYMDIIKSWEVIKLSLTHNYSIDAYFDSSQTLHSIQLNSVWSIISILHRISLLYLYRFWASAFPILFSVVHISRLLFLLSIRYFAVRAYDKYSSKVSLEIYFTWTWNGIDWIF